MLAMDGKYAEALPLYQRAWDQGLRESGTLYNAACSASLAGKQAEALTWLERAAEAGFSAATHMQSDPDLAAVREDPGFARVAEKVAANEAKRSVAQKPELRDELLRMAEEDQAARRAAAEANFKDKALLDRMSAIDQRNTARMKEIIAQVGWPTKTLVSERGARAAWLLVQHADLDPAFQQECLALMEKAVAAGEASGADFAYLTDRVRVAEGKPQLYGTQFHTVDGQTVPRPIEDEANVDARRAAVGLGTMAEYTAQMRKMISGGK
jgi:tetratricopeptide (TPR) repeat protein